MKQQIFLHVIQIDFIASWVLVLLEFMKNK